MIISTASEVSNGMLNPACGVFFGFSEKAAYANAKAYIISANANLVVNSKNDDTNRKSDYTNRKGLQEQPLISDYHSTRNFHS